MGQQFTISRAAFAGLLNGWYPNPEDFGPIGPYGPIIRLIESMLNPQPLPPKARRLPDGWFGAVAASTTIRSVLDRQALAEAAGQVDDSMRASIQQFVDDCGTSRPPRWPFPWPPPKWWLEVDEIGPMDILVAGAQFHRIAETMPDNALVAEFDTGADKLFDTGLQQLGG